MNAATTRLGFIVGLALALANCSGETEQATLSSDGVEDRTSDSFSEVLFDDPMLSVAAKEFERTGLIGALDGEANYTIFVPTNAAFEALGEQGSKLLADPQNGAIVAAVLRNHMVPGALDIESIDKAIADAGGEAAIANLGGGVLSLAREEAGLVVRDASGRKALLSGRSSLVRNGALIAIDTVLVDPALLPVP